MRTNYRQNIKSIFDASIYVAINNDYSDPNIRHKSLSLAKAVSTSGCNIIQYRPKIISYFKMLDESRAIATICAEQKIPFIISDHIDLALDIGADGIHLSHDEVSISQTRAILGPDKIIGITIHNIQDAKNIPLEDLDYVLIANIFKAELDDFDDTIVSMGDLKKILAIIKKRRPQMPIAAIGGIDENNVEKVIAYGVNSICLLSTISRADKPAPTCKKIKRIMNKTYKNLNKN